MTHSPASEQYREKQAGDLQPGDFVYPPGDGPAREIRSVETQHDDYGVAALLLVTTFDGGSVRIAAGSSVPVGSGVPGSGVGSGSGDSTGTSAGDSGDSAGAASGGGAEGGPTEDPSLSTPAETDQEAPAAPAVVVPQRPETPPVATGRSACIRTAP